jgi:hypothetical protein
MEPSTVDELIEKVNSIKTTLDAMIAMSGSSIPEEDRHALEKMNYETNLMHAMANRVNAEISLFESNQRLARMKEAESGDRG